MKTGTIFDSPWFIAERPFFAEIAKQSDQVLTIALLIAALVIILIAIWPGHPLLKAVVLGYAILP